MIAKRAYHKHLGGFWEFPGGKIESNETPEYCLMRELNEELKIEVQILKLIAESTYDYGFVNILLKGFLCHLVKGEFTLTDHEDLKWVTLEEIKNYKLAPADLPFLPLLASL